MSRTNLLIKIILRFIIQIMFGLKKDIPYLSPQDIYAIVESFLQPRLPEVIEMINEEPIDERIKILTSTPQWTLVQTLDNYYISQQSNKTYGALLRLQQSINGSSLPDKLPKKTDYLLPFFRFCLTLRSYSNEDAEDILNKAEKIFQSDANDIDKLIDATRLIQEFELTNDNPNYTGSTEDNKNIKRQLDDNHSLYDFYLESRPEVMKLCV